MRPDARFFRFHIGQLLFLVAVFGVFFSVMAVLLKPTEERKAELESRRLEVAFRTLRDAIKRNDYAAAQDVIRTSLTPTQLASQSNDLLDDCITSGKTEGLQLLLRSGVDPKEPLITTVDGRANEDRPLCVAISCKQPIQVRLRMVELLVKHGADATDDEAMTRLVRQGDAPIAELLRRHGAAFGPRELAAFNCLDELKRLVNTNPVILHERLNPYYAGDGPTLLGIALEKAHRAMAVFLIDAGAPLDVRETQGQTLLHKAAMGGDAELIRLLILRGLDVNGVDDYSETPLLHIAWQGNSEAISELIKSGADVNARRGDQSTALHLAASNHRTDLVRMLLDAGADISLTDRSGQTAYDIAKNRNYLDIQSMLGGISN